jgi:DNA polymerase-3 subunit delta'
MADYRIALLLDFEQASEGASNALLKTLEEPPGRVVLMVTAESADALLPTIVSRCEVLRLRPVPLEELAAGLQQAHQMAPDEALLLAHLSNGKPGYAVHLAQNPDILEQRNIILTDLNQLIVSSRIDRFAYANQFYQHKSRLIQTLTVWLTYWRDILQQTTQSQTPLTNLDRRAEIEQLAGKMSIQTAHQATLAVEQKLRDLRTNIEPRLAAEALLLELPYLPG